MKTYWKIKVNDEVVADALLYETVGVNIRPKFDIVKSDIRAFYHYRGRYLGYYNNVTIERISAKSAKSAKSIEVFDNL